MTREGQKIRVHIDKRRYGKFVTIVEGFQDTDVDSISKELKKKLACGGTSKDEMVELQGNHKSRIKKVLAGMGFTEDMIEIS
jgi:translation initiation factor 1